MSIVELFSSIIAGAMSIVIAGIVLTALFTSRAVLNWIADRMVDMYMITLKKIMSNTSEIENIVSSEKTEP